MLDDGCDGVVRAFVGGVRWRDVSERIHMMVGSFSSWSSSTFGDFGKKINEAERDLKATQAHPMSKETIDE